MNKTNLLLIPGLLLAMASCNPGQKQNTVTEVTSDSLVSRGKYLVTAIGCSDCHSPKRMGPHGPEIIKELEFSGYNTKNPLPETPGGVVEKGWVLFTGDLTAASGPWGTSFAANITSDETGIGNWTEENFRRALREGKYKGIAGARDLLPPMPWPGIGQLSDQDIKAIFMFLKSTNPVHNVVPAPVPPQTL